VSLNIFIVVKVIFKMYVTGNFASIAFTTASSSREICHSLAHWLSKHTNMSD